MSMSKAHLLRGTLSFAASRCCAQRPHTVVAFSRTQQPPESASSKQPLPQQYPHLSRPAAAFASVPREHPLPHAHPLPHTHPPPPPPIHLLRAPHLCAGTSAMVASGGRSAAEVSSSGRGRGDSMLSAVLRRSSRLACRKPELSTPSPPPALIAQLAAAHGMSTLPPLAASQPEPERAKKQGQQWRRKQQPQLNEAEGQQQQQQQQQPRQEPAASAKATRAQDEKRVARRSRERTSSSPQAEAVSAREAPPQATAAAIAQPNPFRAKQEDLWAKGYAYVCGVDEAGRGPLAGPVFAAACIIPPHVASIPGLRDSKKLTEKRREEIYELLTTCPDIMYAVASASPEEIDRVNILQATLLAMERCVAELAAAIAAKEGSASSTGSGSSSRSGDGAPGVAGGGADTVVGYVLVDGAQLPKCLPRGWGAEAIVRGDDSCEVISAASVLAKVTRDRLMLEYDRQFPQYGFKSHKGYGTKEHIAAILKHGPCSIHRRSFAPMKDWHKLNP